MVALMPGLLVPGILQAASQHSYRLERDGSSKYVFDARADRWVGLECEMRVSADRPLPEGYYTKQDAKRGALNVQYYDSLSVTSPDFDPEKPLASGAFRVWPMRRVLGLDALKINPRISAQVTWDRQPGQATEYEPAEFFDLPPLQDLAPNQWTDWRTANAVREGSFAWWAEIHGREGRRAASVADLKYPFEMRCRAAHWRSPYNP